MKKLIVISILAIFSIASYSQVSLWKPVPKDLFKILNQNIKTGESVITHDWIWRLDATIIGNEQVYRKDLKQFTSVVLSGVGPSIGYKHFVPTSASDPTPYCNFGVSAGVLLGTDIYTWNLSSVKLALMANAFQFVKIGGAYTVNVPTNTSHFSIILGGSINF